MSSSLITAAIPSNTTSLLQLQVQLLQALLAALSPDNHETQLRFDNTDVAVGQAYDYPIPVWVRHWLLTNTSATANLYYWFNSPANGSKTLPQEYATLTPGQAITESSDFKTLTLYADSSATDQGWEIRWEGLV